MKPYLRCVLILVLILFLISPGVVWANSGPTYWQGYPSSGAHCGSRLPHWSHRGEAFL